MSDSEWAKDRLRVFHASLSEKSQKDAVFLEEQRIRNESADTLRSQLVAAFNEKHIAINREAGRQLLTIILEPGTRNFALRRNEPTIQAIDVKWEGTAVLLKGGKDNFLDSRFDVQVDRESGTGYFADRFSAGQKTSPDKIAERAIEHLLFVH